jgi:hypothetical protein
LDEVWSSTAIGAPAIFLRAFRWRSFAAIVVHGSPSRERGNMLVTGKAVNILEPVLN